MMRLRKSGYVSALCRPIVETIDRFGLKSYHLHKHKKAIARFYKVTVEEKTRQMLR